MSGSNMFPYGGTSVNIFSHEAAGNDYNTYWQEYARRMGFAPPATNQEAAQIAAAQEQQKVQQMLYDYLLKVWGIPQDVFDCGFEEYKKQMQQQEEKKLEDTREFVRKKLSGEPMNLEPIPKNDGVESSAKLPETVAKK